MKKSLGISTSALVNESTFVVEQKVRANRLPQYAAALSVTLGAFALGTVLAWTSPVEERLEADTADVQVNSEEFSWIGALMALGAAAAAIPVGYFIELIGRKLTLLILVVPFVVGWALIAFATSVGMYYAGRFITGMSGGAFSIVAPVYVGETAEKEIRGALGSYFQLMVTIGILFAYAVGPYVEVMWFSIICGIVPLVFGAIFFFMPETPVYYLKKNKRDDAVKSLRFFRGPHYDLEPELKEMQESLDEAESHKASFKDMFASRAAKRAAIISFGLMLFQQLGGINAVIFYTQNIFQAANVQLEAKISTIIVGVVQVVATFISGLVIDRAGRKVLLIISDAFMGICAVLLAVFFTLQKVNGEDSVKDLGWLPLLSMAVYIVAFSLGYGPIPWVIVGEVFPPEIKGLVGSISCMFNWILAFIVTKFYTNMASDWGTHTTFYIFAAICFIGVAFVGTFVIETKGKSLEEIQRELSGKARNKNELSGIDHDIEKYEHK